MLATRLQLSDRDRAICDRVGPVLKAAGVLFAGIDVIGDYLTEVNVTSPTLIQQMARLMGKNLAETVIEKLEAKVRTHG